MSFDGSEQQGYVVPRYRAADDTAFYHFLHGTVPGHQIDFMYRPDVPQGALTQTHFAHLARLIKYIEPREKAAYAFALGNLSRDDVQHEPGQGGLALLFALRVPGVMDHAGRDMPPYAHGVVAVNRTLDYATLLDAVTVFYQRFLKQAGADDRRGDFYRTYVRTAQERPDELDRFLAQYIDEFSELPYPTRSELGWDFVADEGLPARRISIVHEDDEGFGTLAHRAAALGSLLYRSNIKWTSITSGREIDIAGGTTVRFVARSEAPSADKGPSYAIEDLPEDEEDLAMLLFGAKRRAPVAVIARQGWREKLAAQRGSTRPEPPSPPPRTPEPPPPDPPAPHDSFDKAEVDDAAATLPMAPLEADPAASPPAQPFDARQSSPMNGMRAPDLRRSSPAGGMRAAVVTPPPASVPAPSVPSSDASINIVVEPSAGRGRWLLIGAVVAAIGVLTVIVVSFGLFDSASGADGPGELSSSTAPTSTPDMPRPSSPGAPAVTAPSDEPAPTSATAASAAPTATATTATATKTTAAPPVTATATPPSTFKTPPPSKTSAPPARTTTGERVSGAKPVF